MFFNTKTHLHKLFYSLQKNDEKVVIIFLALYLPQYYFANTVCHQSDYGLPKRNLGF